MTKVYIEIGAEKIKTALKELWRVMPDNVPCVFYGEKDGFGFFLGQELPNSVSPEAFLESVKRAEAKYIAHFSRRRPGDEEVHRKSLAKAIPRLFEWGRGIGWQLPLLFTEEVIKLLREEYPSDVYPPLKRN